MLMLVAGELDDGTGCGVLGLGIEAGGRRLEDEVARASAGW